MDVAERPTNETLLTTAELAAREDFTLGAVIISPSTRTLRGPAGTTDVEPRVMQVLVGLADAIGQVVTRETLFNRCWGGVHVGDDSLNRAVAAVRRAIAVVGGKFEIETIPRTGYLLKPGGEESSESHEKGRKTISRRGALIAAATVAAAGAAGLWRAITPQSDLRFDSLILHAEDSIRKDLLDDRTVPNLQEAIALRPDSARAWGLLAYVQSVLAQDAAPKDGSRAIEEAETAARRALAIDSRESNALLAMFELQGSALDWTTRDRTLRQIITFDPRNLAAINELVLLLQAVGYNRESWDWNQRALAIEPLSRTLFGRRALKLWIAGNVSGADQVIDQARVLWPSDRWIWGVRLRILALSGRLRAAQSMLDGDPAMMGPTQNADMWRKSLIALDQPSPASIATARQACLIGARTSAELVGEAVMILCALGEVDTAFDVAHGFLLSRGSIVRVGKAPFKEELNDAIWRVNTQWLFVPPAAVMRADARFLPLCEDFGLTSYWRSRGVSPDYQLATRQKR